MIYVRDVWIDLLKLKHSLKQKERLLGSEFLWYMQEGKDIGLLITLVPKVLYNVFLFVGLTTLGTSIEFDWLVH